MEGEIQPYCTIQRQYIKHDHNKNNSKHLFVAERNIYLEKIPTLNRCSGNCTGFGTTSIFLSGRDFARNIE